MSVHTWQLQEAKAKFSEVIKSCSKNPQIISVRGVNTAVVLSVQTYEELCGTKMDLVSFFRNSPLYGVDLDLERDKSGARDVQL
ncbi:MAG: type II toxin-antitoxin system Phd/YefM family antitoxin [Gammaproteobacteria bacterium]